MYLAQELPEPGAVTRPTTPWPARFSASVHSAFRKKRFGARHAFGTQRYCSAALSPPAAISSTPWCRRRTSRDSFAAARRRLLPPPSAAVLAHPEWSAYRAIPTRSTKRPQASLPRSGSLLCARMLAGRAGVGRKATALFLAQTKASSPKQAEISKWNGVVAAPSSGALTVLTFSSTVQGKKCFHSIPLHRCRTEDLRRGEFRFRSKSPPLQFFKPYSEGIQPMKESTDTWGRQQKNENDKEAASF
eukprot:scaffold1774_cov257-Pinguiococcus_pyrenoidosus.AAC.2